MTKEEIKLFEKKDKERAESRRKGIGLNETYRVVRTDHFRVFTNFPKERQWDKWLQPHLLHMEALYRTYRKIFIGLVDDSEARMGLDSVFFKNRKDYKSFCALNGIFFSFKTAGIYSPILKASFFYRDRDRPMDKTVLLHELTHQLNRQVLHAAQPNWADEGLALYFEVGRLKKNGFLEIGNLHPLSFPRLRYAIRSKKRYIPAEKIFHASAVDDPIFKGYDVTNVYDHLWGWVYYFLHRSERTRRIFFEGLRREIDCFTERGPFEDPRKIFIELFSERGIAFAQLDRDFKRFFLSLSFTGK